MKVRRLSNIKATTPFLSPKAIVSAIAIACAATAHAADAPPVGDAGVDYFDTYIEPLLAANCYECHSHEAGKSKGGLVLDSRAAILAGGDNGSAVDLDNIDGSLLLMALGYEDEDLQMPPDGQLDAEAIAQFREWVEMGLPHAKRGKAPTDEGPDYEQLTATHWSLQPVADPAPPAVGDSNWPLSELDHFVLATLEASALSPAPEADAATLLRRLHFDLTGLPPSPDDVSAYLSLSPEGQADALPGIVDTLLDSPHFGERWGRHWLDQARFAESNGKSRDVLMPHAWRYRNYVFDAFANDMPFDQFIREQIAGDLLPADDAAERDRQLIATGFLAVGPKSLTEGNFAMDLVDDQIDVVTQSVLALTVACARCHDHKFDPIPTADYYSLAGIFSSTETRYGYGLGNKKQAAHEVLLPLGAEAETIVAQLDDQRQRLDEATKEHKKVSDDMKKVAAKLPKDWRAIAADLDQRGIDLAGLDEATEGTLSEVEIAVLRFNDFQSRKTVLDEQLASLKAEGDALPELEFAMAVSDQPAGKIADQRIHVRGEPRDLGETVARGFLDCVDLSEEFAIGEGVSGRRELAHWLTHPDQPLTPRVAANRIWHHLFGRGLVPTINNFGITGESPSHPELLDWLAHRLVHEHAWSQKALIRDIVLSRSYRMSSALDAGAYAVDPDNRLLWRMNRKRIEAEPLRDAVLAVSGELERERPDFGSRVAQMGDGEVGRGENTKPLEQPFPWRAAYLPVLRTKLDAYLKTFDFPEPSQPAGARIPTNVPAQALWLMNSPLVTEQSKHFAQRVIEAHDDREARIAHAIALAFGREATATEREQLAYFLEQADDGVTELDRWAILCQALYASAEFRYLD